MVKTLWMTVQKVSYWHFKLMLRLSMPPDVAAQRNNCRNKLQNPLSKCITALTSRWKKKRSLQLWTPPFWEIFQPVLVIPNHLSLLPCREKTQTAGIKFPGSYHQNSVCSLYRKLRKLRKWKLRNLENLENLENENMKCPFIFSSQRSWGWVLNRLSRRLEDEQNAILSNKTSYQKWE